MGQESPAALPDLLGADLLARVMVSLLCAGVSGILERRLILGVCIRWHDYRAMPEVWQGDRRRGPGLLPGHEGVWRAPGPLQSQEEVWRAHPNAP